jgi:hypothetical protein
VTDTTEEVPGGSTMASTRCHSTPRPDNRVEQRILRKLA